MVKAARGTAAGASAGQRVLGTGEKALIAALSSMLVIFARGASLYTSGRLEGIVALLLGLGPLLILWILSIVILARSHDNDAFCLVMKGIGLPSALFAFGEYWQLGG